MITKSRQVLSDLFNRISKERHLKNYRIDGNGELAWVVFERKAMFEAVNELRSLMGKQPVTLDVICKAENSACGHSDYYLKFPMYCAEIVEGL